MSRDSGRRRLGLLFLVLSVGCSSRPVGQSLGTQSSAPSVRNLSSEEKNVERISEANHSNGNLESLLVLPEFEAVRNAVEARDDELAVLELREVLSRATLKDEQRARAQYLLGTIEERRGEQERAAAAYGEAGRTAGALRWDALAHLASLEMVSGDCRRAKDALAALPLESGRNDELSSLNGKLAACEGDFAAARHHFAIAVQLAPTAELRAYYQTELAECLLQQLGPCGRRAQPALYGEISDLVEAVRAQSAAQPVLRQRASALAERLSCSKRESEGGASFEQSLTYAEQLLEQRLFREASALLLSWEAELDANSEMISKLCRVQFAQGRAAAGLGDKLDAEQRYEWVAQHCDDSDLVARALYLRAGLLVSRRQYGVGIQAYAELIRRSPEHRLADDGCLKMAKAYQAMGSEKLFVETLVEMPDRFPEGDMTQEGLFALALHYLLRRDISASVVVLERAQKLLTDSKVARQSERERVEYFLAVARLELDAKADGLAALERLVKTRPLSYYMILAYSRLVAQAPELAVRGLAEGLRLSESQSVEGARPWQPSNERVRRALVLLAANDLDAAGVQMLGVGQSSEISAAFWPMVELYAQAQAWQTVIALVKNRADDYRSRWPVENANGPWLRAYPLPYRAIASKNASETGVPPALIYAIMREESEFDPKAVSLAQAYGLMQLIVPTAATAAKGTRYAASSKTLLQPATNIALGSRVLQGLLTQFDGSVVLAVAGYNAGPGRARRWLKERPETPLDRWIEAIEYAETRNYVKRVLESRAVYAWLYAADRKSATIEPLPLHL